MPDGTKIDLGAVLEHGDLYGKVGVSSKLNRFTSLFATGQIGYVEKEWEGRVGAGVRIEF